VENVFVAAVQEWSDDFMEKVWYAYLMVTSYRKCYGCFKCFWTIEGNEKSSVLRHAFVEVSPVSVVKIEMIEKSVLILNNEFSVSYFIGINYTTNFIKAQSMAEEEATKEVTILFVEGGGTCC
jgi:hypothetical protein